MQRQEFRGFRKLASDGRFIASVADRIKQTAAVSLLARVDEGRELSRLLKRSLARRKYLVAGRAAQSAAVRARPMPLEPPVMITPGAIARIVSRPIAPSDADASSRSTSSLLLAAHDNPYQTTSHTHIPFSLKFVVA